MAAPSAKRLRIRFDGEFAMVGEENTDYFAAVIFNVLIVDNVDLVAFSDFDVYEGRCG